MIGFTASAPQLRFPLFDNRHAGKTETKVLTLQFIVFIFYNLVSSAHSERQGETAI